MKRPVAKFYTPSAVLSIEPLIDSVMSDLCDHLDSKHVQTGKPCDIGSWIAYCRCNNSSQRCHEQRANGIQAPGTWLARPPLAKTLDTWRKAATTTVQLVLLIKLLTSMQQTPDSKNSH